MYVMCTTVIMMLYTAQCHCEMFNVFTCLICLHVFNVTAFHGKQSKAMNGAHSNAHIPKQFQSNTKAIIENLRMKL